jgi:hypothetical protein
VTVVDGCDTLDRAGDVIEDPVDSVRRNVEPDGAKSWRSRFPDAKARMRIKRRSLERQALV